MTKPIHRKIVLDELNRLDIESFKEAPKNLFVFVLDNIRSINNVGSAFRTADAFRAEKIYLCGITGTPPHRDIEKTALGSTDSMAWQHEVELLPLLKKLREQGCVLIAIEQAEGSIFLQNFMPDKAKKYAFIFGNEVFGVQEEAMSEVDFCLEIPQFGTKHSLNVSVSMGIVAWDYVAKTIAP